MRENGKKGEACDARSTAHLARNRPGLTSLCGHAGVLEQSHFKLRVVSDKFEGMPLVKRHQ
jgi:stress-induced morphogen